MKIKFEVIKGFEDKGINLPKRGTAGSAGYDFEVAENVVIPPHINVISGVLLDQHAISDVGLMSKGTLVKTGVKAKMPSRMYLAIHPRSSLFNKKGLILANSVGVIDSDYYGNPDNDGHIMLNFINLGIEPIILRKGEKVGQGIFHQYFTTDDDESEGERTGGFGSTGGVVI